MKRDITWVLLAGGKGLRMGRTTPKQYLSLYGQPVVLHSFRLFKEHPRTHEVIVVCAAEFRSLFPKETRFAQPGATRQESSNNGFEQVTERSGYVAFHDAARPFVTREDLDALIFAGEKYGAALLATPVTSTYKTSCKDGFVSKTIERSNLWECLTPQIFRCNLLEKASIEQASNNLTDNAQLFELAKIPIKLVEGSRTNRKLTHPEDLANHVQ